MENYGFNFVQIKENKENKLSDIEKSLIQKFLVLRNLDLYERYDIQKAFTLDVKLEDVNDIASINIKLIKLGNNKRLFISHMNHDKENSLIRLLVHEKNSQKVTTYIDFKEIGSYEIETTTLKDEFYEELTSIDYNTDISPQAGLPCIQSGCCVFGDMKFKWCGAGCGSGTPINALDTCCRTHDYCYGSYGSYPDRCKCDANLINCATNTSNGYKSLIITAFKAKRLLNNC